MNLKQEIEIMSELLEWCRMYAVQNLPEAWDWYAVFCTAWNRLGKSRLEGVEGYEKLKEELRQTQESLREMEEVDMLEVPDNYEGLVSFNRATDKKISP